MFKANLSNITSLPSLKCSIIHSTMCKKTSHNCRAKSIIYWVSTKQLMTYAHSWSYMSLKISLPPVINKVLGARYTRANMTRLREMCHSIFRLLRLTEVYCHSLTGKILLALTFTSWSISLDKEVAIKFWKWSTSWSRSSRISSQRYLMLTSYTPLLLWNAAVGSYL